MQTIILDSQILSNLQRCALRTHLYFDLDLRSSGDVPDALQGGILVHTFFGEYYRVRRDSGNKLDWESCAHQAMAVAKPFCASLTLPDEVVSNVFRSLSQYVELYKHEPMEVKFVEEPFAIELFKNETIQIIYVGVIDLVASIMGREDKLYDHKSQKRKSDFLVLDDQFQGYATAAGMNILTVNVIGLQATLKPEEKFRRVPLSFPPYTLERWKAHAIYYAQQYLMYTKNNEWPENHQGCNKFALCDFYQVCTAASEAARAWKLKSEYMRVEKWDPTKVLVNRE